MTGLRMFTYLAKIGGTFPYVGIIGENDLQISFPWMIWSVVCYLTLFSASIARMVLPTYKEIDEVDSITHVSDKLWSCLYSTSYIVVGGYILLTAPSLAKILERCCLQPRETHLCVSICWKEVLIVSGSVLIGFASITEMHEFLQGNKMQIADHYGIQVGFMATMIARTMGCFQNFMLPALFNIMLAYLTEELKEILIFPAGGVEMNSGMNALFSYRASVPDVAKTIQHKKNESLKILSESNGAIHYLQRQLSVVDNHRNISRQHLHKSVLQMEKRMTVNDRKIQPEKLKHSLHKSSSRISPQALSDMQKILAIETQLMEIDDKIDNMMRYFGLPLLIQLTVFAASISISLFFLAELLLAGTTFGFSHAVNIIMPSINFLFINDAPHHFQVQRGVCALHYRRVLVSLASTTDYSLISRMVDVLEKKTDFSLMGFFCLGRSCVTTALGFIISYMVIGLQFLEEK